MEENKRMWIAGIVMLLITILVTVIYFVEKPNSDEYQIYFMGRSGCGYCTLHKPGMDYITKTYDLEYEYIDTDTLTDDKLSAYLEKFNIASEDFATPATVIMKGNEVIDNHIGFLEEKELYDWFKEKSVIQKEYVSHYPNLKYIGLDEYKTIVESNDQKVIALTQATCTACMNAKPYLDEVAKQYNIEINYYDLLFTTQEDYDYFYNSYSFVKEKLDAEQLSTPTFLIVKNKKIVATLEGFESKDKFITFLNENGII